MKTLIYFLTIIPFLYGCSKDEPRVKGPSKITLIFDSGNSVASANYQNSSKTTTATIWKNNFKGLWTPDEYSISDGDNVFLFMMTEESNPKNFKITVNVDGLEKRLKTDTSHVNGKTIINMHYIHSEPK